MKPSIIFLFALCCCSSLFSQVQVGETFKATNGNVSLGWDVDINDDGMVIAMSSTAILDTTNLPIANVLVYRRSGEDWTLIGDTLRTPAPNNGYGYSIALSGDGTKLAIGIPSHNNVFQFAGAVHLYEITETELIPYPTPIEGEQYFDGIGFSVDLSYDGKTLVVGNQNPLDATVKVYEEKNGIWQLKGNPITSDQIEDFFGGEVKIDHFGNVISAMTNDIGSIDPMPFVEVFEFIANDWVLAGKPINSLEPGEDIKTSALNSMGDLVAVSETDAPYSNIYFYDIEVDESYKRDAFIASEFNLLYDLEKLSFANAGNTIALQGYNGVRVYYFVNEEWVESDVDISSELFISNASISEDGNFIIISYYDLDKLKNEVIVYHIGVVNALLENASTALKIYPNPVVHQLIVDSPESDYEIYEMASGRKQKSGRTQDGSIEVSDLNPASYLLTLTKDGKIKAMKFIKTE